MRSKSKRFMKGVLAICTAIALIFAIGCSEDPNNEKAQAEMMEEISGYWAVEATGDTAKTQERVGMFNSLFFDAEGNMKIIIRIQDSVFEREGTYTVEITKDEKLAFINVPEYQEEGTSDGPLKSLSAKAIEDGKITFDGDTLTTTAISTDGAETIAHKITDEEYQAYVDEAIAKGPKTISVGEEVTTPVATFTVESLEFVEEIEPSDTSGYYTYYEANEGYSYLLATVSYTNTANSYAIPGYFTSASVSIGDNTYDADVEMDAGTRFGSSYRVEAKATETFYIYAAIPDAAKDSGDVKLTWSIPNETQYMNTFYQSSFPQDKFVIVI